MKRLMLLVMLLILGGVLLNVTNIYAATGNSQTSDNNLNTDIVLNNTTNTSNNETIQNSTGSEDGSTSGPVNDTTATNKLTTQTAPSSSETSGINSNNSNITNVQNSTDAARDELYKNVRGIWLSTSDVGSLNIDEIKESGITDIFIKCNINSSPTYQTILSNVVNMFKGTGIRVNAWIACFMGTDGKWINPAGTAYTYTVKVTKKVPVKTTRYKLWYKYWYKSWYKYKGKWKYKLKYKWKYVWKTKTTYKTITATETKTGVDTTHNTQVLNAINDMVKNYGVNGINLDYIYYPGTAYKYSGSTQIITSFVKSVYNSVKSIKPKVAVSADVMPEGASNSYYYGQNYTQLAKYLDFMVPMIYKGNYGYNSSNGTNSKGLNGTKWIGNLTSYIVSQANGTPVITGLQTYRSESKYDLVPANELQNDINAAISNGASGYALFRYGKVTDDLFKDLNNTSTTFTLTQIQNAATSIKSFIETYNKLPNYVTVGTTHVSMPDMLRLMTAGILQLNSRVTSPITLKDVNYPSYPTGDTINGNINKTEYLSIAQKIKSFIDSNRTVPPYMASSLGNIRYESIIYMYSKILNFYTANSRLPNYVTIEASWASITSVISQSRPVYITSDNINSVTTDTNRINTIVSGLKALGLTAINYGLGPNTHYSVLQNSTVPVNALIVDIYGGACAGTIYEMGQNYYKALVGARKVFSVWMPPATDITGLTWLPRSHDDDFDPPSFTGLANPDQYLLNNGYDYIYSGDLNTIINSIYREAITS